MRCIWIIALQLLLFTLSLPFLLRFISKRPTAQDQVVAGLTEDEVSELFQGSSYEPMVDLARRTRLIRLLLEKGQLDDTVFGELSSADRQIVLDNMSPARLAFDMEAGDEQAALVAFVFYRDQPEFQPFLNELQSLAKEHQEVKFVLADGDKLIGLVDWAPIQTFPTLLFVKNGEIVDFLENPAFEQIKLKIDEVKD